MAENRRSGKLAVILHADVAGSTSLVQQDEHRAHERILDTFRRFGEVISNYHGHVRELRGDALLAEFERASDAVSATLAFQATQSKYNDQLGDAIRPEVRVGIAMGEVIIADDTVTGSGVVLAQRVERLAEPGGLCVTAAIHEALPQRMPFVQASLGEQEVKGFEEAVRVYRVSLKSGEAIPPPEQTGKPGGFSWTGKTVVAVVAIVLAMAGGVTFWLKPWMQVEKPASVEQMAFPLPDKPSIAVLPFTNMSDDTQQEYFADGMTEDLITDLSKLSGLFVIARNSVFTYKGKPVKVKQVAEELGVRYVMEGSVRRVGNQVRINAQLIDATTGGHLWAERYDGSLEDVFTLQDNITEQIVSALALNLTQGDTEVAPKTVSAQAYDAFLKGWRHYQRHSAEDLKQGIPYLEQAVQLDSGYAQAYAALAAVYWEFWNNGWTEELDLSPSDTINQAKQYLEQALKEPTPLAHWVASNIQIAEGDYQQAVAEAEQIVALDNNNAAGYAQLANALELSGQTAESAKALKRAIRLDPYASPLHLAVQKGDADAVKRLIAEQPHIDGKDVYGKTPLHVAADNGHAEIAALLIAAGADIEARTRTMRGVRLHGMTPLILSVVGGYARVAELLISAGADVNARDRGAIGTWTTLYYAANSGHVSVAELLIDNGADVDATTSRTRQIPLFRAVMKGHKGMVELLINKGSNVKATSSNASTPLHLAATSGEPDIAQLLLTNGADVNAKTVGGNYPGATPLHNVAYTGDTQIAELLLANGADINATDQYRYTPLRRAVDKGNLDMVALLIEKDAGTASEDIYGVTPLHVVAQSDHTGIAELLIKNGADVNAKDHNLGFTPLDYAQDGEPKMIEILERHGGICTSC